MTTRQDDPQDADTPTRALARAEERFRLLVESVVDYAIFMLDPDGIIQTWNAGAERVKGYPENEIVGQHYSVFYTDQDRAARLPQRLLATAREKGRASASGWRVRRDGSRFWADVVITALREDDGQLVGFAKVTRDMTDSRRTQQAREQALVEQRRNVEDLESLDRWRRDFISSVAHDLQAPVTTITGFARILLDDRPDAREQRDFLERILSNARSLEALIDHLRTYALLESGRIEPTPEVVELGELVAGLVTDMQPLLGGHTLAVDVDDVEVCADRPGLERILRNLLTNAVRHTPSDAGIRVRARAAGDEVVVEVEDEGEGIDEELLPRMFDRFERGRMGGTGLGLSIVKQYVELHGGEVSVESRVGEGATFRFTIPRAAP